MRDMFEYDENRCSKYSYELNNIFFDLSKNRINFDTTSYFVDLVKSLKIHLRINDLFEGEVVNNTEGRAATHTSLRDFSQNSNSKIEDERNRFLNLSEEIRNSDKYKHVVQIGIGGSYLGPKMVNKALSDYLDCNLSIDFISNIDDNSFEKLMNRIDPSKTLFIVASKSLSTSETMYNYDKVLEYLDLNTPNENFICITSKKQKAIDFGFKEENILLFDDTIGGRYSVWSSIGITIAIKIGKANFIEFLKGAELADIHFRNEDDYFKNIPFILAFINVWYRNFFDLRARAVVPYSDNLVHLPEYLQQLEMESLGKIIDKNDEKVRYATGNIIFGNKGTNSQHSFFQMLHQGVDITPVDFIASADSNEKLLSNCFAQSRALMSGNSEEIEDSVAIEYFPGNIPSNTILFNEITPSTLGTYLAIQEHKVFVQSVIWNINPFDQFGVELGKKVAKEIEDAFDNSSNDSFDSSTNTLIKKYQS
jgi:glucose-6-phosphate isomerase